MGIELSLGDWETWREILGMLFDSLPEYTTKLMAAKNNPDELSQIAHKLVGASCYCGTPALNKQARKLERFAKKGDVNSVAESLDGLLLQIDRLLALKKDGNLPDGKSIIYS